jgi:FdhE protein
VIERSLARLEELAASDPVGAPLARLQVEALRASTDRTWSEAVPAFDANRLREGFPLLHGQTLRVSPERQRRLVAGLAGVAAGFGQSEAARLGQAVDDGALDVLALLEAAIVQDAERLERLAADCDVDPGLLSTLAQLATLPVLQACGRRAAPLLEELRSDAGSCPVCAAWPTLAEVRGLARARRLRCGRCGADWEFDPRRCPFCGTADHRRLGSLVPEEGGESRRVDTCQNCRGYLKSLTTLRAWPADCLPLEDLATVYLDIAALEHGYARPERPGYSLNARLVERPASRRGFFGQRR